ncbi:MAG: hypothetical protein LBI13_09560 [Streptococcaceae bacterium]|jgi:hypothetical protein|nr:hypothetical protein [Streptococcaceae bacterium]
MQSGYCQPLSSFYKLVWIWWVIFLSFQQVFYYENNLKWNFFLVMMLIAAILIFYFLIRQRRFFASQHHLYFTRDFRFAMVNIDLAYISAVRISSSRFEFMYAGKPYSYLVIGPSNQLLRQLLKENSVEIISLKS